MLRILFLAANTASIGKTDLAKEVERIFARLRETSLIMRVETRVVWDASVNELEQHLRQFNPNILHISGHGTAAGEPLVLGATGRAVTLPLGPLAELVTQLGSNVQCIVLNACNTDAQAAVLTEVAACTVAMQAPILNSSAVLFASSFYTALAAGDSVQAAFDLARLRIAAAGKPDADVPVLRCQDAKIANELRLCRGLSVFCLYDHADQKMYDSLVLRLKPMMRAGALELSGPYSAAEGEDETLFVSQRMRSADIYILLTSPNFIGSDECMLRAEEGRRRANLGQAVVVPVLMRDSDWQNTVFGALKPLPSDRVPVLESKKQDQAWQDVVVGIRAVLKSQEQRLLTLAKSMIAAPLAALPTGAAAAAPAAAVSPGALPAAAPRPAAPTAAKNPAPSLPKTDAEIIQAVRVRRHLRNLPRGLDREIADVFDNITRIKAIIQESGSLLSALSPGTMPLPLSYVPFDNGALMAWYGTLTEAAKVGPLALVAILLVVRSQVDSALPILEETLRFIVSQEA